MFDLPVKAKKERKEATRFRHYLLDQGFEMAQFSVYMRYCSGKEQAQAYIKRIQKALPNGGKVDILTFTDKQYSNIVSFNSGARQQRENPNQYLLF